MKSATNSPKLSVLTLCNEVFPIHTKAFRIFKTILIIF